MLAYSGLGRISTQMVDLSALAGDAMILLQRVVSKKASFNLNLAEGLPSVQGDVSQIRQIVMNLITNASEALCDETGSITLTTGVLDVTEEDLTGALLVDGAHPGSYVFMEVTDTGSGIDAQSLERIFDPFFSTKFTGRGLGLAAVLGIVRGHRGFVQIETTVGEGTTFRICLPSAGPAPVPHGEERSTVPTVMDVGTVLVIDDEEPVRRVVGRILERAGIQKLMAVDGDDGVDVFRANSEAIGVVLLDLTMPGMSADRVFQEISRLKPSVRIILSSGYLDPHTGSVFGKSTAHTFLQKPYRSEELLRALWAPST
jgi:CheY-like chemotaxis protein